MEKILFLAHTDDDGALPKAAREVLRAAVDLSKQLGAETTVGLFGREVEAAADSVASCGARFLGVAGEDFAAPRAATDVAAMAALVRAAAPTIVVAPTTSRIARAIPAAAARVGGRVDTRVTGIGGEGGELRLQRWYYRQRMLATQTRAHRPWFLVVESGIFATWEGASGAAAVEEVDVQVGDALRRTRVRGVESAQTTAQTIRPEAELLFVAGAGWTKKQADGATHPKDAERLILGFLEKAKASLGGSKSLVDQSGKGEAVLTFMTHLNQVGQTGSTPRHAKGLATCCHGEEPHVVGWRFVRERRAVNLDPNCGWAQGKTDVLYVADAFQVMEKVNALLAAGQVAAPK
ncbi:MAG: electron transfer flavoprotein subunit alpha [bacterium]